MNACHMIGNMTRDPELRTTNSGSSVCRFTIAVTRKYRGKDGEKFTDFIDCVAWGKNAENACKYLRKGSKVAVNGELHVDNYEKNGEKKKNCYIECDERNGIEYLSNKSEATGSNAASEAAAAAYGAPEPKTDPQSGYVQVDPSEEELPF